MIRLDKLRLVRKLLNSCGDKRFTTKAVQAVTEPEIQSQYMVRPYAAGGIQGPAGQTFWEYNQRKTYDSACIHDSSIKCDGIMLFDTGRLRRLSTKWRAEERGDWERQPEYIEPWQ
jgi:hypothetical protein